MDLWLSAVLAATAVGAVSFCLFYFISLLRSSRSADLRRLENLARHALYRAGVLFGITLLIVGFNPELIPKLTRFLTGSAQFGLARRGEIKVWVNTKSGFYYCPGTKAYGKLEPGSYMTEAKAVQNGYQPFSRQACR
jgi:hypothetical protein